MVFLYITREANEGMVTSADNKTMIDMGKSPTLLQTGVVDVRFDLPARGECRREVPECLHDEELEYGETRVRGASVSAPGVIREMSVKQKGPFGS